MTLTALPGSDVRLNEAARAVQLVKIYGAGATTVRALDGISVAFERGCFTSIMGPSGSGKSTLLHCLAGLDTPTSGSVFIGNDDLSRLDDRALTHLRRDRLGFVFQAFNLLPTLNAAENITLPLTLGGRTADPEWLDAVVDVLGIRERLAHRPSELSGGEQQRVAVARALVGKPEIVFADEPTGNLDTKAGASLLDFIRRVVDEFGQTVVMVTHDPIAAAKTDRIVFLVDGRVTDELRVPTVDEVIDRMRKLGG